ncbi:triosephosphate isomerase [Wolbachia endosymbiont of Pentidionis agamae]|uniref:triosephosphate isomerase n=1 Tax=Wolbachia endosymbiont of Pentidionis agamae TaxID=3110435 RepID=UPI002FD379A7
MPFLVVANWKMNGTRSTFMSFIGKLNSKLLDQSMNHKLVICPPFTSLPDRINLAGCVNIGAQNCHHKRSGSYTGEVSAEMLKDLGCTYVILGHSERNNESNNLIKLKAEMALACNVCPIICIGESLKDYEKERTEEIIVDQCKERLPTFCNEYIIAYEPIWAIGTGVVPSNELIEKVIKIIKLNTEQKPVIYGGSVNSQNIEILLKIKSLAGVLIGSASLDFDHFYKIIEKVKVF